MAGAVFNSDTAIGDGRIVNTGVIVGIGRGTWMGIGSVVSTNVDVCAGCMIGTGANRPGDLRCPKGRQRRPFGASAGLLRGRCPLPVGEMPGRRRVSYSDQVLHHNIKIINNCTTAKYILSGFGFCHSGGCPS